MMLSLQKFLQSKSQRIYILQYSRLTGKMPVPQRVVNFFVGGNPARTGKMPVPQRVVNFFVGSRGWASSPPIKDYDRK